MGSGLVGELDRTRVLTQRLHREVEAEKAEVESLRRQLQGTWLGASDPQAAYSSGSLQPVSNSSSGTAPVVVGQWGLALR